MKTPTKDRWKRPIKRLFPVGDPAGPGGTRTRNAAIVNSPVRDRGSASYDPLSNGDSPVGLDQIIGEDRLSGGVILPGFEPP